MSHSKNLPAQSESEKQAEAAAERERRIAAANEVRREEWERIRRRRQVAFGSHVNPSPTVVPKDDGELPHPPENLVGLSLSGGGIRSALYNDGFLQGLSHRGLLRYVDYLSTVSGGGYIGGHLISQAKEDGNCTCGPNSKPTTGFHDDKARWPLGRDPESGKVDPKRLQGIGSYLNRPVEMFSKFIWSCAFSMAFYVGMAGVVATLLALFWRSFDDPVFRRLFQTALGIKFGNELLIAFIPAILVLTLGFGLWAVAAALRSWTSVVSKYRMNWKTTHERRIRLYDIVQKYSLAAFVISVLISLAVFIGNGKTNVRTNAGAHVMLNHYAQTLAIVAGIAQILVFLGRDRLFRSERQEAKSWQKRGQVWLTSSMIVLFGFAMVHWMAREDLSGFTQIRDPAVVPGDVGDWRSLDELFTAYEAARINQSRSPVIRRLFWMPPNRAAQSIPVLDDFVPDNINPGNQYEEQILSRSIGVFRPATPDVPLGMTYPAIDALNWTLTDRLWGAVHAYRVAVWDGEDVGLERFAPEEFSETDTQQVGQFVEQMHARLLRIEEQQVKSLERWNSYLESPQFTRWLLNGGKSIEGAVADAERPVADRIFEWIKNSGEHLKENQRERLITYARLIGNSFESESEGKSARLACRSVNRMLLEILFPFAIQRMDVASTFVVPPYDQQARREWLVVWLAISLVGAGGSVLGYKRNAIFQFYRKQVGDTFLRETIHGNPRHNTPLVGLCPTNDGLPHPLILAAEMEPVLINGTYSVQSKPFVFSPVYCGELDPFPCRCDKLPCVCEATPAGETPDWFHSKDGVTQRNGEPVTLAGAVTISGAAVSRLMTSNRSLSILLDFFNSGLGRRVYFPRNENVGRGLHSIISTLLIATIVAGAVFLAMRGGIFQASSSLFVPMGMGVLLTALIGYCISRQIGTPYFLKSLFVPREVGREALARPEPPRSKYVADGGFYDYLGVTTLLERRCELMIVSDAGAHLGDDSLGTLARICEQSRTQLGVQFFDLDHDGPIDFGRLNRDERRLVHQPYMCMRVRYPKDQSGGPREGLLFYCQMAITERDPVEIQQIRNRFPSFPDEPTTNQFYTDEQVSAYRTLGYHIADQLCHELERWDFSKRISRPVSDITLSPFGADRQFLLAVCNVGSHPASQAADDRLPLFRPLTERLLVAYRLSCYEELSHRQGDVFSEAIWPSKQFAFPNFAKWSTEMFGPGSGPPSGASIELHYCERWLSVYERSADVRSAYRKAILEDINQLSDPPHSYSFVLLAVIMQNTFNDLSTPDLELLAPHLCTMGIACQEIHCGRPHATFQIGGREKLRDLCLRIAGVIWRFSYDIDQNPELLSSGRVQAVVDGIVTELLELERSVFQRNDHLAMISFAECIVLMWGRQAAEILRDRWPEFSIIKPTESQMVELRNELHLGTQKVELKRARYALQQLFTASFGRGRELGNGPKLITRDSQQ